MSKKRIGILTSGGDCPGLNAVIRGAVKACHQLGYDCVGFQKGYEGLHDPVRYVHLTPDSTRGILNQGGTILGSTNKGRFAATVGVSDRKELDPELMEGVKRTIKQLSIDGLICVGGDGSLAVAQQFHEQGIPVVGVPKTIDNDLSATAFTFGFDSAIECATDALDRLHTTAASHERIMVLEVMGRHAGWIALHAGIAGGGDVILLPEVEWNYEHVCHKILHRESQGKRFTLVVVAEGAHLPEGGLVGEHKEGQQMKLGGVGRSVADEIERRLHRETRLSVLGHLQRGGSPTTFDRVLATQFGAHAVRLVKEHRFGEMICSRPPEITSVPIMEAVNVLRTVDPHGHAVQAARALGISFGDRPADEIGTDVFDKEIFLTGSPDKTIAEQRPETAPQRTVTETPSPTIATAPPTEAEKTPNDEEQQVEEVAETMLDMVHEADEAAHGPVGEIENKAIEDVADSPADEKAEAAPPAPIEKPDLPTVEQKKPVPKPLELNPNLQDELTARIAAVAKSSREQKPSQPKGEVSGSENNIADMVKQKLASAAQNLTEQPAPAPAVESFAEPALAEQSAAKDKAETEASPGSPTDSPFEDDLIAEARSALEEALGG